MKRRKGNTRYPHAFSKGKGVGLSEPGTWRPQAPCAIQMQSLGAARPGDMHSVRVPNPGLPDRFKREWHCHPHQEVFP